MNDPRPQGPPPDDSNVLPNRDEELEHIVDQLDENVTDERERQGVPGNAKERKEQEQTKGSDQEPPD